MFFSVVLMLRLLLLKRNIIWDNIRWVIIWVCCIWEFIISWVYLRWLIVVKVSWLCKSFVNKRWLILSFVEKLLLLLMKMNYLFWIKFMSVDKWMVCSVRRLVLNDLRSLNCMLLELLWFMFLNWELLIICKCVNVLVSELRVEIMKFCLVFLFVWLFIWVIILLLLLGKRKLKFGGLLIVVGFIVIDWFVLVVENCLLKLFCFVVSILSYERKVSIFVVFWFI